jgi:hypothetical protein
VNEIAKGEEDTIAASLRTAIEVINKEEILLLLWT